jgi:hypothetical protein
VEYFLKKGKKGKKTDLSVMRRWRIKVYFQDQSVSKRHEFRAKYLKFAAYSDIDVISGVKKPKRNLVVMCID